MAELEGPLAGVRLLDFTWMLAGPYCTMLLADLGAEVIKVEPPGGDPMREAGPFRADDDLRAYGGYFQSVNRNKKSLVVDLKTTEGRDTIDQLVGSVDAVAENFRSGVMERLGVGYNALRAVNPRLVYASIRGFGDVYGGASPYMHRPAVDPTIQAIGGLMSITGGLDGTPMKSGPGIADIFPGALCALGIVAAVLRARNGGMGQYVDVSMYDGVLALCERIVYQHSYTGEVPGPAGNGHPLFAPFDLFSSADGYVAICASEDPGWRRLCELLDRRELIDEPRFRTSEARAAHAPEIRQMLEGWTSTRSTAEIVTVLGDDISVGELNTVREIFADPHPHVRDMLVDVEQPGSAAPVTIAGCPIKFSETPSGVRRRAPLLGEHTDEILADLTSVINNGSMQ
jgi:crotonobetainyl-CoA:carnitine CoA-transferase CaiB-like acyl-CoA transferase